MDNLIKITLLIEEWVKTPSDSVLARIRVGCLRESLLLARFGNRLTRFFKMSLTIYTCHDMRTIAYCLNAISKIDLGIEGQLTTINLHWYENATFSQLSWIPFTILEFCAVLNFLGVSESTGDLIKYLNGLFDLANKSLNAPTPSDILHDRLCDEISNAWKQPIGLSR